MEFYYQIFYKFILSSCRTSLAEMRVDSTNYQIYNNLRIEQVHELVSHFKNIYAHSLCICVCFFCITCMVLSYVRPHNNLSTCATGYLLLLASVISSSQSPLLHLLLFIIILKKCKYAKEIKDLLLLLLLLLLSIFFNK